MSDVAITTEPLLSVETLAELWRGLDRAGAHNFFLTWTWVGTWLRLLPPSVQPVLLKAMDGNELVGFATLTLKRGKLRRLMAARQAWLNATGNPALDCIMIEHNGFACAVARGDALLQALMKAFAAGAIPADELVLPGIVSRVSVEAELIDVGHVSPAFRAPLHSVGGGDGIESLLSRNARQQLRRNLRAWQRKGPLSVEIAQDAKTALEFFEGLKALHVRSWTRRGRKHAFASPFFETFHRALIVTGLGDRNVDLVRVSAGAHVLGYVYNFRRNGTVSNYQSGFDDTEPGLRSGYVCHALAMAHYAAAGMSHYDFLAGANRLKQSFGPERYELYWRRLRKVTVASRTEALIRRAARTLRGVERQDLQ
jgi:CelD/BcsL family acetyltransferase involved in cellulose biosynthesis